MANPLPEFNCPAKGAIYMRSLGFDIFPLKPNSKEPAHKKWQEESKTFAEGTISSYIMGHGCENANFGIHPSHEFFVVDIDNKGEKKGSEVWDNLILKNAGDMPATLTVQTPTGGMHKYFRGKGRTTQGAIGKHIDTRATGGFVVAPGSLIDGKQYEIIDSADMADAPAWLLDALSKVVAPIKELKTDVPIDLPGNIETAIAFLKSADIAVEGENGDLNLFKVFAKMKDLAVSQDQARELVLEHYNPRCEPPWDGDSMEHFEKKLEQGYKSKNPPGIDTPEARLASAQSDFDAVVSGDSRSPEVTPWLNRIHQWNEDEVFPDDSYFLSIGDQGIVETGDLMAIQAKTKAGKSAVIGAMLASMFAPESSSGDFLGFSGHNWEKQIVLHFDTEQKPKDHHALLKRACSRADLSKAPTWFHSYCIKSLSRRERVQAVEFYLRCHRLTGGVKALFIDGIADLCDDTNDKEKSERLGELVVHWSQAYGCAVIFVLHENPSKDNEKMRGHLGTYFEMKAEVVLRVEKDAKGISQVWGDKMRRGHIAKGDGPRFAWDISLNRHASIESVRTATKNEANKMFGAQIEELAAFMNRHLPGSTRMALKALNEIAKQEGRSFAGNSKPDQFADWVQKLAPGEFQITHEAGPRSTRYIAHMAPVDELAALVS